MEANIIVPKDNHFIKTSIELDIPEVCPICNKNMLPTYFPNASVSDTKVDSLQAPVYEGGFIARCTSCRRLYSIFFKIFPDDRSLAILYGDPYFQTKIPDISTHIPQIIKKISPNFEKIYTQALQAENLQLNELVGMGFRKALEFLIKDYAVSNHPEKETEIKKMPLSQVIEKHIDYNDLKVLAKGATWIGNDETHYVKKWPDKDISDLKNYIKAFMAYIELKFDVADAEKMIKNRNHR